MNTVKIMGGIGNQLFQYAFARAQVGDVGLDISFYSSPDNHTEVIPSREFILDKFNCRYKIAINPLFAEIVTEDKYDSEKIYQDTYFVGYWQKEEYFKDIEQELKRELTLKDEYITEEMKQIASEMHSCNSVSIHVRRNDFVTLGHSLDKEYYTDAIKAIRSEVKKPKFYVFSDDMEWCKKNFPSSFRFIHIGEYQDFYLMQQAKNNIISNSTYSYWAYYLNKNKNIMIAPMDWKGVPCLERGRK